MVGIIEIVYREASEQMTNKELDKWIAENVMGWKYGDDWWPWWYDKTGGIAAKAWHPTESISDAFQVVEKMIKDKWIFDLHWNPIVQSWFVKCYLYTDINSLVKRDNKLLPLTICLAAKKAIEAINT